MDDKSASFEERLEHAKAVLEQLMDPNITLEASMKAYEAGMAEIKAAQKMLEEAKLKIVHLRSESSPEKE
jgi:exodeoxyribonuclease VII small subunit